MKRKLLYFVILTAVSTVVAYLYVHSNDGFGKGDIRAFATLSVILSSISLLLLNTLSKVYAKVNTVASVVFSVVFSIIQATLFVLIVWLVYGPWIGAFSFPIHWCWFSGTIIANFYLLIVSDNKFNIKHFAFISGSVGLVLVLISSFNKVSDELANEQNFDIVCLVHRPSDAKLSVDDLTKFSLTTEEAIAIIDLGLKGTFWTDKYFRVKGSKLVSTDYPNYDFDKIDETPGAEIAFKFGNSISSEQNNNPKIIVIMNHPMESDFGFNEPLNSSLIAYQHLEEDQFLIKHLGEESNSKKIIIKKTDFRAFPHYTSVVINLKNRGEFLLHGFQWLKM